MEGASMLRRRSSFFPSVPEILELPCLQTSPSSGRHGWVLQSLCSPWTW